MIKVFALGGLEETSKTLFVVEVDQKIFVFDCGIKNLKNIDLGFNSLIADFSYLIENRSKICGLFLTKIDAPQAFGVNYFLKHFPNVKVYLTEMSYDILVKMPLLSNQQKQKNLVILQSDQKVHFNNLTIDFFTTATNLFGSCGYILEIENERIIFTGDFVIGGNGKNKFFRTDIDKVLCFAGKNLLLISNVAKVSSSGFTVPKNFVDFWATKAFQQTKRNLYIACFENDWYKIFSLIKFFNQKKDAPTISFVDSSFQKIFRDTISKHIANDFFVNLQEFDQLDWKNNTKKIIFVTGDEKWIFSRISRLINENEKIKKLSAEDYFLILGGHQFINELSITNIINELYKTNVQIEFINSQQIRSVQASAEDLKFMISMIKPTYFFPFGAMHSELLKAKNIVKSTGFIPENIFLCQNGDVVEFKNQTAFCKHNEISAKNIYIDNLKNENISENIIRDRRDLSLNGAIIISFAVKIVHSTMWQLVTNIEIKDYGVSANSNKIDWIHEKIFNKIRYKFNRNKATQNKSIEKLSNELKKEIETMVNIEVKKSPLIFLLIDRINE